MKFQIENPALLNSRFRFDDILFLDINFHRLNLTRGSSYLPLPDWIEKKKAIVNSQNNDEECFKWAVITGLEFPNIKSHPERISNLTKFSNNYDWSSLEFPVLTKDIGLFKINNDVLINVLAVEGREIYIHRKSRRVGREINLLFIHEDGINHYTAIKSLSRLLSSKNSNTKRKQHFCTNCLQGFTRELSRDQHQVYCEDNETVRVEMPREGSTVEFCDGQNQFKAPFFMYADFESILEPIESPNRDPNQPYIQNVSQHVSSGWCVYSKFAYSEVKDPLKIYRGKDCVKKFCDHVKGEAHRLYHAFPEKPMGPLTKKQWKKYKKASRCHICFKSFTEDNPKVSDHCHYSSLYRGAALSLCNLRYRIPSYIPVVFHNLSCYDAHLFIRELATSVPGGAKMGVITKNKKDYITFSIKIAVDKHVDKNGVEKDKEIELRFIDSFKFMSSSLDSLVTNLVGGGQELFGFEGYTPAQYELLVKKGIYPYEYMSKWEKFNETKLPPKEAFYSKLNMVGVSEENYEHVRKVWREFEIKNLGEYHDLYFKVDVILLANVFEAFREVCLKNYGLDPAHFYIAPGLAWKACFKKKLELG